MNDLLQQVLDAHGGLDRWNRLERVSADLEVGGVLWALKGQSAFAGASRVTVDLHRQRTSHAPFLAAGQRSTMEADRVSIETADGRTLAERDDPRASFAGHSLETPWDATQLAYFTGYAMWTYLTAPFCFAADGFEVSEIAPWIEDGEPWRRLRVRFPPWIATHCREQTFYYDRGGLLCRHDYDVDVAGGSMAAHYVHGYQAFDGIQVPTRRRVFVRDEGGHWAPEPLVVSIDLGAVEFS